MQQTEGLEQDLRKAEVTSTAASFALVLQILKHALSFPGDEGGCREGAG